MQDNKKILDVKKLDIGYNNKCIVKGIDFEVYRNEVFTIIGPNGAGKSTLLRTLAGLIKPINGEVLLLGKDMKKMGGNEVAKAVSLLLTEKLNPELMNCEDVVASARYPYTGKLGILTSKDYEEVESAMRLTGVLDLRDVLFSKLSDGQKQRVMLARAICQNTKLLIMDEPTSFLDINYKIELLTLVKELIEKRDLTVIMTMHDLDMAEMISDRVLSIKDGKVDRIDCSEKMFSKEYILYLYDINRDNYSRFYGRTENI